MTKLEEIARAIWEARREEFPLPPWEDQLVSAHARWQCRSAARAAVEALREPSEAMIEIGDYNIPGQDVPTPDDVKEVWQAMIDAILNEKPE